MKTDEKKNMTKAKSSKNGEKPDSKRQKKQLIMLSSLAVLLVAVLFIQFGGSEPEFEAAALAEITLEEAEAGVAESGPAVQDVPVAKDNPVLLQSKDDEGLLRNAFSNFWDGASADEGPVVEITPPSIRLSATMPGGSRSIAVIDGRIHFVGDMFEGWKLTEIHSREVVLKGPKDASAVVDMPVIFGRVTVPEALQVPAESADETSAEAPEPPQPQDG